MTLDHLQESYNEQIQALARAIGTDDASGTPGTTANDILYGLQSTTVGSAFTANRGAIYHDGEIFLVPSASFTIGAGEYPVLVLNTTYATGDPTEFTDGNTYNVHQIRTATIVSGTTSTANYIGTFSEFTNKKLPTTVTNTTGITFGAKITSGIITAKRDHLGVVILSGNAVMNSSFVVNDVVCTLPATHRPISGMRVVASIVNGSNNGVIILAIGTNGIISVVADFNSQIGNNANVILDNIVFYNV